MTVEVRLLPGGNHTTKAGRLYVAGDTFEVDEDEVELWPDRFEVISSKPVELKTGKVNPNSPVSEIDGIGPATARKLKAAGVITIADLATADVTPLAEATGLDADLLGAWASEAAAV